MRATTKAVHVAENTSSGTPVTYRDAVETTSLGRRPLDSVAGDGGRRSRRGFAYQDVVALLDCLELLSGHFDSVEWESTEDIVCRRNGTIIYRQVKTQQTAGRRHSLSTITDPDRTVTGKKKTQGVSSSIAGKLFTAKDLASDAEFHLVVNEVPQSNLHCFTEDGPSQQRMTSETQLAAKLSGLEIPNQRTPEWCVQRMRVVVMSREVDELETMAIMALAPHITRLAERPLLDEAEDILVTLLREIGKAARGSTLVVFDKHRFLALLEQTVARHMGRGDTPPQYDTLSEKLTPVGLTIPEISAAQEQARRHRRRFRNSVGASREQLERLSDEVHAVCQSVMAARRAGELAEGAQAYNETLRRVSALVSSGTLATTNSEVMGALADVTSRCRNRYVDARG